MCQMSASVSGRSSVTGTVSPTLSDPAAVIAAVAPPTRRVPQIAAHGAETRLHATKRSQDKAVKKKEGEIYGDAII